MAITGNQMSVGTYWWELGVTANAASITALHNAYIANIWSKMIDCHSTEVKYQYNDVHAADPNLVNPRTELYDGDTGTKSEESLPTNIAVVFKLAQIVESGRHNGRIFLPGVPEVWTNNGVVSDPVLGTPLQDLATAMGGSISHSGKTFVPCVVVRKVGGIAVVPYSLTVAQCTFDTFLKTQRRRRTELTSIHP